MDVSSALPSHTRVVTSPFRPGRNGSKVAARRRFASPIFRVQSNQALSLLWLFCTINQIKHLAFMPFWGQFPQNPGFPPIAGASAGGSNPFLGG